jgi:hypothetical protein
MYKSTLKMTDLQGRILSSWLFSFGWDGPWVVPFQYRVRQPRLKVKIISTQISEQKILM